MFLNFDDVDQAIIQILQDNSSISNIELSKKIKLSPSACLTRTKRLKDLGVIKQYATMILLKKV